MGNITNKKALKKEAEEKHQKEFCEFWSLPIIKCSEIKIAELPERLPKDVDPDSLYLIDVNHVTIELYNLFMKMSEINCAFVFNFEYDEKISFQSPKNSKMHFYPFSVRWFFEAVFNSHKTLNFGKVLISIPNIEIIKTQMIEPPEDAFIVEYNKRIEEIIQDSNNCTLDVTRLNKIDEYNDYHFYEMCVNEKLNFINRKYKCYELHYTGDQLNYFPPICAQTKNRWPQVAYIWLTQDQLNRFSVMQYTKEQLKEIQRQRAKQKREQFFNNLQFDPVKSNNLDDVKPEIKADELPKEEGQI